MSFHLERILADDLPSQRQIALNVVKLVLQPEPNIAELIAAIKNHSALRAKLLKTANSAVFGQKQRVVSIKRAVLVLGITRIKSLVLDHAIAQRRSSLVSRTDVYQRVWNIEKRLAELNLGCERIDPLAYAE